MAQEKAPDNKPTEIDPTKKDEHLQADLTDEELKSVVGGAGGGAAKSIFYNITGSGGR